MTFWCFKVSGPFYFGENLLLIFRLTLKRPYLTWKYKEKAIQNWHFMLNLTSKVSRKLTIQVIFLEGNEWRDSGRKRNNEGNPNFYSSSDVDWVIELKWTLCKERNTIA
jgi:hypothetical protein